MYLKINKYDTLQPKPRHREEETKSTKDKKQRWQEDN